MKAASGSMPHFVYLLLWIAGKKVSLYIYIYIYIVMFLVVVEVYIEPASFHGAEKRKKNKITINKGKEKANICYDQTLFIAEW